MTDPAVRVAIWERDGGVCGLCGEPVSFAEMHIDHIEQRSVGGGHEDANLRPTHKRCNLSRPRASYTRKERPGVMTMLEAARRLGVSRSHVYTLIERGQLRAIKNPLYLRGTWVAADEVAALLEQMPRD